MFGKNKRESPARQGPLLIVLGESARLDGTFNIGESIQIECEVAGEINVEGKLVIGEKGVVRADVHTADAVIRGRYEGSMVATGNVEIAATGRVSGNIQTDSLVISKGGFFDGTVTKMQRGPELVSERHAPGSTPMEQKQAGRKPF